MRLWSISHVVPLSLTACTFQLVVVVNLTNVSPCYYWSLPALSNRMWPAWPPGGRDTSCCCPEYWSSGLNSFNLYHFTIFPKRLLPASPCQTASATCSQWEQIRNDLIFQCGREWSAYTSHSDWRCHPLKITQISNPFSSFLKGIVTICFLSHFM